MALDAAAAEYAYAIKRVGAEKIHEAIDHFAKIQTGVQTKTVEAAVGEFLAEKKKPSQPNKRPASERYLTDMNCRLVRFAKSFACEFLR